MKNSSFIHNVHCKLISRIKQNSACTELKGPIHPQNEDNNNNNINLIRIVYYIYTSCPGAPVAPRHAASCHVHQHYVQSRNLKYSTCRDPGG